MHRVCQMQPDVFFIHQINLLPLSRLMFEASYLGPLAAAGILGPHLTKCLAALQGISHWDSGYDTWHWVGKACVTRQSTGFSSRNLDICTVSDRSTVNDWVAGCYISPARRSNLKHSSDLDTLCFRDLSAAVDLPAVYPM